MGVRAASMTADAVAAISATPYRRTAGGSWDGGRSQGTARSHRPALVLGYALLRRIARVRSETLLDPMGSIVQALAELATDLFPRLGGKEQAHCSPDDGAERERSQHAQGHVACRALLLQADQPQHVVGRREMVAQLRGQILQGHA